HRVLYNKIIFKESKTDNLLHDDKKSATIAQKKRLPYQIMMSANGHQRTQSGPLATEEFGS
ncbi:MAG: hypothetical protein AAF959_08910, partial [Cyanobacteria bacterium P01_D01_bin.56]